MPAKKYVMSKNALQIILYSGIFSTAYTGFFYQKYTDAAVTLDIAKIRPASPGTDTPLKTAALQVNTLNDSNRHQIHSQYDTGTAARTGTAETDKNRREIGRLHDKMKIHNAASRKTSGRYNSSLGNSSHNIQTDISSPATAPVDQREHSYSKNPAQTTAATGNYRTTTTLAYTANPAVYTSTRGQTGTADSAISSYDIPATAGTGMTINGNTPDNSFAESSSAGDGSEFLPDGSSQQDLVDSLSKKPRVYTIKDYQQADISCSSSYSTPTAHADLIYGLKGC